MDTVPITLTSTPDRISAVYAQLKQEELTIEQVSDTQLTVYVVPTMSKDEAITLLVNNK